MNPKASKTSTVARCSALALLALAVPCRAAQVVWTGASGAPTWSTAGNWNPANAPVDGDGVVLDGAIGASVIDLSLSLDSLTFASGAGPFNLHVAGGGTRTLSFSGAGIENLTAGTGPIRQAVFADAGSTGASIVFTGSSGINLGSSSAYRPIDLTALGGNAAGQVGGRIVFQDQSSTGVATFNALRAVGATSAGAGAGVLAFLNNAIAKVFTTLTLTGGSGTGAAGGQGNFSDSAQVEGIVNVMSGAAGGAGGRAVFGGSSIAALSSTINNQGGQSGPGSEGVTVFGGSARLTGTVINAAATAAGANGGRIEFRDQAAFDSTGYNGGLGSLQILNQGGSVVGAGGGSVVFRDDSVARGGSLVIVNGVNLEGTAPGTLGGTTRFLDRSQAGSLTIINEAGAGVAGIGQTWFENTASAGTAQITNNGGSAAGFSGGQTVFTDAASAGNATLINAAGDVVGGSGGVTRFVGNAGAGHAYISNQTSLGATGGGRGTLFFADASSAQNATIDNQGGLFPLNAFTVFSQSASAGSATITNFGGRAALAGGGSTSFVDSASAGAASLVMAAGTTGGALGGKVEFFADASAGSAALDLRGASVIGAAGGIAYFHNSASAGTATITVGGSQANNPGGPEGALVSFGDSSTASSASVVIGGNALAFGARGRVQFVGAATAANASFTTLAGYDAGGALSFEGTALTLASAGNAHITNGSRATPSGSNGDFGGATAFLAHSTADHAVIVNDAGRTAFGAQTVFRGDATAADASIRNAAGNLGDRGGITFFQDNSSAGRAAVVNAAGALNATGITNFSGFATAAQATLTSQGASANAGIGGWTLFTDHASAAQSTLIAEGGSNGGLGGRITFLNQANGGGARVVLGAGSTASAGGVLDIGGVDVWVTAGSIEGAGIVALGARSLILADAAATTIFSGVINGTAAPVFPSLTVQQRSLTLTGANEYAGRTQIGDGVNAGSGKLVVANTSGSATGSGAVLVVRGGTLSGSGFVAGPVQLFDGGTIAPGDPVTLTLRDRLTWDGGGVIRLVLGADSAGSDHLDVGTLIRGADGLFAFDLVDAGITAGAEYDLVSFDAMSGFVASDFEARGYAGTFAFDGGTLGFTATGAVAAVPEPDTYALLLVGLVAVCWAAAPRARRRSAR